MDDLKQKRLFLLDMDGTIYLDDDLFDGTLDFLEYVRGIGGTYLFLTNNSSKSTEKYVEKLQRLGIPATAEDFLTSVHATVLYLRKQGFRRIYALGTEAFRQQLRDAELPVTDHLEEDIDCLCMGFDTELTFRKLEDACILLSRGVAYVATNPDLVCPTRYGFVPDCGSVSGMLKNATGRVPLFIGKPQSAMVELALEKTGCRKEDAVIVGDRLYTDIACGVNAGISSVFVLSGEGTLEDLKTSAAQPTFVVQNIRALLNELK